MNTTISHLTGQFQSAQFVALFLDALLKSLLVLALASTASARRGNAPRRRRGI